MDLSQYNPTAAADVAQRFELIDPFTQKPITDDDGTTLAYCILGMQSTVAKNEDARIRRNAPKPDGKVDEMDDEQRKAWETTIRDYSERAGAEKLAAMVTSLEGTWQAGDKDVSLKTLANLLQTQDWIANQMFANASTLAHYRPKM